MRSGTLWHSAVLSALALLMSGQLCMVTTCVPRMHREHALGVRHACCRATPESGSPGKARSLPGAMPCDVMLHAAVAPVLTGALPLTAPAALTAEASATLDPPADKAAPFAEADTGRRLERHSPAAAGLRAPPRA
jgi:hypothetical protein